MPLYPTTPLPRPAMIALALSSVLAARARMKIMGIGNVSTIQSAPDDLLETLKANHGSGVSVAIFPFSAARLGSGVF